ncbi:MULTISPECIES: hypothetical protein [unclassified Okeania]|nr:MULTISPECIES: hypothetical protein [unclassified Okeania]NEP75347.1 hypothetical protein [Okeania sp. SIO2G5]
MTIRHLHQKRQQATGNRQRATGNRQHGGIIDNLFRNRQQGTGRNN